MEINIQKLDKNGFLAKQELGYAKFVPPCVFYVYPSLGLNRGNGSVGMEEQPTNLTKRRLVLIFICIPVSPGKSRLIWTFPRNFGVWIDRVIPRWIFHIGQNLILDSDLYLLHLEERKINDLGPSNWHKACFVPTKSDALVSAFRKWLRKYSGGQVNWGTKFSGALPPTPPKEQLMDRYWSHVVNCSSCSMAVKGLKAVEVALQCQGGCHTSSTRISISMITTMASNETSIIRDFLQRKKKSSEVVSKSKRLIVRLRSALGAQWAQDTPVSLSFHRRERKVFAAL
ncbi:hypothetical protein NE237_003982 [Protea cynaroides]|uniref:Pheophorbide a oxygenase domain-containing protein n=1 Tax=Protea cynaroides TaxID=273540 RepID=A0A9Q0KHT6_9MAGN|nr:hypothetical protein NE237_003982 [Protea cynaroides]